MTLATIRMLRELNESRGFVDVPAAELGADYCVRVKRLPVRERIDAGLWSEGLTKAGGKLDVSAMSTEERAKFSSLWAGILIAQCIEENGEPLFAGENQDLAALLSIETIGDIVQAAIDADGVIGPEVMEAKKNDSERITSLPLR